MPEGVRKVFEEELAKLQGLEPAASEANLTRYRNNYLLHSAFVCISDYYYYYSRFLRVVRHPKTTQSHTPKP